MKKNFKKNNKGFTLVELIIVVAVIAVLAAVLAPQYLQYVERSRESNDLQIATSIMRAATVAIADPGNEATADEYIITWNTAGTATPTLEIGNDEDGGNAVLAAVADVMGWPAPANATATETPDTDTDAQSANGNAANFEFTISTSSGAIDLATASETAWGPNGVGIDE